jgi:DNA polymerase-1
MNDRRVIMASKPRLYLIDGHALAYRTYFALTGIGDEARWMTQGGEPTAGTYGFTSVLLRLLEQDDPEFLGVAFDKGPTFRDEIFPEYKATREKMPDDLRLQLDRIRQVVEAFGIPIFEAENFEADDVLGTLARRAVAEGVEVIIITGDRDLLQLADEGIRIQLSGRRLSEALDYGPQEVVAKMGIKPDQIVDYKALVGDKSDNIPGVRGVGEKTAVSLLNQYGTLDEIYAHIDEIPARFQNKLREGKDNAYLSRKLAAIDTEVPMDFDLQSCQTRQYDSEKVLELFRELEFRSLLGRLIKDEQRSSGQQLDLFTTAQENAPSLDAEGVVIVDSPQKLEELTIRLQKADRIAFDVETTSTIAMRAELVGISLAVEPGEGYYLPVGHQSALAGGAQLPLEQVIEALREPLTDTRKPKVGHNLKYDYILLARHGLRAAPLGFDTMLAEWLCNPASRNLGLKNLAWTRLGAMMTEINELIGSGRNQRSMDEVSITKVAPYAVADAEICLRLLPVLEEELKEKQQLSLFHDVEMPQVPVLAEMEIAGVGLDLEFLSNFSELLSERLGAIENQIFAQVGHEFNVNSTQQLSTVLFDELGLQPPDRTRRTASGHYSTAASVLFELRQAHPIVEMILEQREIAKLKSTYAEALQGQIHPETGRVHTSYNPTGSVTGRLASSDPNLQNIPIRSEIGRQIRRAFVAAPNHLLLSVDYSQIELRIVAHMAGDKAMIEAFRNDQDIHATTAATVFDVSLEDVSSELRRRAKAVNFGLIYGMSAYGLSRSTDLTLAEAEDFVKTYFERFPGVKAHLQRTRRQAAELGYVETLLGRRRYFPQLMSGAQGVSEVARARAYREAINAPIQGSAADIIKLAMMRLPDALTQGGLRARMILQVHDELVFECPENEIAATADLVGRIMRNAFELKVPLKTDAKAGINWAVMEPIV